MDTTLEQFLKFGRLGPVMLGMSPVQIETLLGDPQDRSERSNPLLLKYGPAELTFWRIQDKSQLVSIDLSLEEGLSDLPPRLVPSDWVPDAATTLADFRRFLTSIEVEPSRTVLGEEETWVSLPSGVQANFQDGYLASLRLSKRDSDASAPTLDIDDREPSIADLQMRLSEAARLVEVGGGASALVLAWGTIEAALRRLALRHGLRGKIGTQPGVLIRELAAGGFLGPSDLAEIDAARQLRTQIIHGLAFRELDLGLTKRVVALAQRLLLRLGASEPVRQQQDLPGLIEDVIRLAYERAADLTTCPPDPVRQFAAGGLMRCCTLLRGISSLSRAELALVAGILERQHWETWLVSLYVLLGGEPALRQVADDDIFKKRRLSDRLDLKIAYHPDWEGNGKRINFKDISRELKPLLVASGEQGDVNTELGYDVTYGVQSLFAVHAGLSTIGPHIRYGEKCWTVELNPRAPFHNVGLTSALHTLHLANYVFERFGLPTKPVDETWERLIAFAKTSQ